MASRFNSYATAYTVFKNSYVHNLWLWHKNVQFELLLRYIYGNYLLRNSSKQTGRVSRHHFSVEPDAGQILVHVYKIFLQGFLHLQEIINKKQYIYRASRLHENTVKVESFLSAWKWNRCCKLSLIAPHHCRLARL